MLSIPTRRTTCLLSTALTLIAALAPSLNAQTPSNPTAQPLEFEAATIKPSAGDGPDTDVYPDGLVKLHGFSLRGIIEIAFNVNFWQIADGESWIDENAYDVTGEPPDAVRQTHPDTRHTRFSIADPRLREMLQSLLIDRFHLKVRSTTQTGKVFFLERTSKPLALRPAKAAPADSSSPQSTRGEVTFIGVSGSGDTQMASWLVTNATLPEFATFASIFGTHRPVFDHTGLTGAYDYQSRPELWDDHWADPQGSFNDFLKEIGLKLTPSTGPTETLTIDHADLPTPN